MIVKEPKSIILLFLPL